MKNAKTALMAVSAILMSACIVQAATVVTVDDQALTGSIVSLDTRNLILSTAAGNTEVETDGILSVELNPAAETANSPHAIRLRNGDFIFGRITGGSEETLTIEAPLFGKMTFPLSELDTAWFDVGKTREHIANTPPREGERDSMILRNDDSLPGLVLRITENDVTFDCALGRVPIPFARIRSLSFAPLGRPYREPSSLLFDIRFTDGSTLTAGKAELRDGRLLARSTLERDFVASFAEVARINIRNGRLIYLSDIEPVEVKQVPMFDERPWPYQRDRSVSGSAITLNGREFRKGLGMHSRSEISFKLDGAFSKFAGYAGINDDATGGHAEIKVLLDGKQILPENGNPLYVVHNSLPLEIELDVSGGQMLTLIVDFGENLHINDHVSWGNARLLR